MLNVRSRKLSLFAAFVTLLTMLVLPGSPAVAADASVDCDTPGALQTALDDPLRAPGDTLTIEEGDTCFENILIDGSVVNVTIEGAGAGATIDGSMLDTVVDITPGFPSPTDRFVTLRNLTVTGGDASGLTTVLTDPSGDGAPGNTSDIVEVSEAVIGPALRLKSDFGAGALTAGTVVTMNFDVDQDGGTGGSDGTLTGVDVQLLVRGDGTAELFSAPFPGPGVSEWTGSSTVTASSISVDVPLVEFAPTEDGDMDVHVISDNAPDTDDAGTGSTTAAGPAAFGGGIRNGGSLTLDNVTVAGNSSATDGGAIWNGGNLQIDNSTIGGPLPADTNTAANSGGGIFNLGTLTTTFTFIQNNAAVNGAGVYGAGTSVSSITSDSVVMDNVAGNSGGGIYSTSDINVLFSNVSDNTAVIGGGGIYSVGPATLTIDGSTIDNNTAGSAAGILAADPGHVSNISDSFVRGNDATSGTGNGGGGIENASSATMTVTGTEISGNTSAANGGAGIRNADATLNLSDVDILNNTASGTLDVFGGGLRTSGDTLIDSDSLIQGNSADVGGGVSLSGIGVTLTMDGSAVDDNDAIAGAGISVDAGNAAVVGQSAITRNDATSDGGGFALSGDLTLTNSTVSTNTAANGAGLEIGAAAVVGIDYSTIALNVAATAGGGFRNNGTATTLEGTIVFGNSSAPIQGEDCSGPLTTAGYNLIGPGIATCVYTPDATDVISGDPVLGPLTPGSPEYHPLGVGSDAIDAGGACVLTEDQNGDPRPQGAACDIGAAEFPNSPPAVADDAAAVERGGTTTELVGGADSVLDNDGPDPEGDPFTAVLETDVTNGTLVLNADGTFSYTHDGSATASDSFTYRATDGQPSALATVSITVSNSAPVAANDSANVELGGSVNIDVQDNDEDPEGDDLTTTLVSSPSSGTAVVETDGTITYTHDGSPMLSDTFTYEVSDGLEDSNVATVTVTVIGQEDRIGLVEPNGRWHLRNADESEHTFFYGNPGDVPLFGDWDGDGLDTPGMFRPSNGFVYLTNTLPPNGGVGVGDPDLTFFFGIGGDQVVVGDWDGDGMDTLGIRRNGKMFLTNVNATSVAEDEFFFGVPADIAYGGDPDGDGEDSIFLYRATSGFVYYTNDTPVGPAAVAPTADDFFYGVPSDEFVIGDWDGDGIDSVGIFRPAEATVYLRNSNTLGPADETFAFGQTGWLPVAGMWN